VARTDPSWLARHWALLFLTLILAVTAAVRLRTIDIPLERDEGEYAYVGQLLLQGVPPYGAAYNMKFPGIYAAYAAMMAVFGESTHGIHVGLLVVNAAAILLVYLLGTWLAGRLGGVVAAGSYALLSMSPSVLGLAAHATHFIVVPALAGLWLLVKARGRGGYGMLFAGGVCLGIAILMKQHAAFFAAFGIADAIWSSRAHAMPWRRTVLRAGIVGLGILAPVTATVLALLRAGVFDRFWFWTIEYARVYAGELPLREGWSFFRLNFPLALGPAFLLWLLAGFGMIAIWLERDWRDRALWISGLALCSFLATVPGFWFRQHYFIVLLPVVAMLAGVSVVSLRRLLMARRVGPGWSLALSTIPLLLAFSVPVDRMRNLLSASPYQMSRELYGLNPFSEAVEVSRYISANSEPGARIAVLGSEPQIYFYTRRRSATGYLYTYGLMELVRAPQRSGEDAWVPQPYARRMQEEMIREVEAAQPEFVVFAQVYTSWLAGRESEHLVLDWSRRYVGAGYDQVGVADILAEGTEYRWGNEAATYQPRSPEVMYVFRKK
jgi:Dolichyl-phosphate-mannose-protein mannosyltransferase